MPKPKKVFSPLTAQSAESRRQNPAYPKPDVPAAFGDFLSPRQVTAAGLEVVVSYPTIKPGDVIALKFNGDDTFVPIKVEDQTSVSFWVSVGHIIKALGTTVDIQYTLGGESAGQRSDIMQLTVLPFMEGDLEMAVVKQATPPTPGLLDLNTFSGDADIEVGPWPLISAGQTIWLDMIYQKEESLEVFSIIDGERINATEVSTGIKRLIDREELKQATDESTMEFPLSVNFSGSGNRNDAIAFTTLKLIYKKEGQTGGAELIENFEKLPSGYKPSPFVTDHITFTGAELYLQNNVNTNNMYLSIYDDSQKEIEITFHTLCSEVSFFATFNERGLTTWCFYGDNAVDERSITGDGNITFLFPKIKSIKIRMNYTGNYWLDDFRMITESSPEKIFNK